jgi:hypothetical protein
MIIANASSATAIHNGALPFAALINATMSARSASTVLIDMGRTVSRI